MIDVRKIMLEHSEQKVAEFSRKLIPGENRFLGIRVPVLRQLAKDIAKDDWRSFLNEEVNEYHEDTLLWGAVVSYAKMDIGERISYIEKFIPKITNWAICDMFTYKAKSKEREIYWNFLLDCVKGPGEFGMRFGAVGILGNFIDEEHIDRVLRIMDSAKHDGYYLKMGVAWTLSVCFVKFPEKTMAYLNDNTLDDLTYNKTLQKILESYRIDDTYKSIIREMKRKRP